MAKMCNNLAERLNYQLNREIYSAYFYLAMAAYAAGIDLNGFSNWFNVQFKEELVHAQKIFDYLKQRGGKIKMLAIEEPPQDFSSGADLFEKTLEHEKKVTAMIKSIAELAKKEKDEDADKFLQWFIKEQKEEEESPAKVLERLKPVENDRAGILRIDAELAKRK